MKFIKIYKNLKPKKANRGIYYLRKYYMDKKTAQIVKDLIDNFIEREELLKELLNDREKELADLKVEYDKMIEGMI
jgi:hypothetical protein